jgi:ketosteroid isomerase-like protein
MIPTPTDFVRAFYEKLSVGDAAGALGFLSPDVEWTTMWHYQVSGRGPAAVAEGILKPLAAEWSSAAFHASEFIAEGDQVVSLGEFTGVHGSSGKHATARYAHVWTVKDAKIVRFRQYIDTLAIAEARNP